MSYLVTTETGTVLRLPALTPEAVAAHNSNPTTQAVIQSAIDAGSYTEVDDPVVVDYDPVGFRLALLGSATWQAWSETLSPHRYSDLTIAAQADHWPEVQALYGQLKAASAPSEGAVAEWQQYANQYGVEVTF